MLISNGVEAEACTYHPGQDGERRCVARHDIDSVLHHLHVRMQR